MLKSQIYQRIQIYQRDLTLASYSLRQPAVTTVARTPFRVQSTFRTCYYSSLSQIPLGNKVSISQINSNILATTSSFSNPPNQTPYNRQNTQVGLFHVDDFFHREFLVF